MKYKVRITKAPNENMAYGGQSGYGMDLGQRGIYDTMNESGYESVSDTAQPVPRNAANIEAELGETMVGDMDGDGRLEHMNIAGKPHSKGGTPLNVKPGTFVFSQTKKMAFGGPALQAFGKSGKTKYTPAQLAKQYDLNKYKAVMENPDMRDDDISQRTAQMMYQNNAKKLGMLALIQEGMKGFPQGIPDIAQSVMPLGNDQGMTEAMYGGYFMSGGELPSYQKKGEYPGKLSLEDAQKFEKLRKGDKNNIPQGYTKIGTVGGKTYYGMYDEKTIPGQPTTVTVPGKPGAGTYAPGSKMKITNFDPRMKANDILQNPGKYKTFHERMKGAPEEEIKKAADLLFRKGIMPGKYTAPTVGGPVTQTIPGKSTIETTKDYIYTEDGITPNTGGDNSSFNNDYGRRPFFGNSLFVGPQRERFYAAPIGAMTPEPTFYDPNRELAANAEQANITQQYLAGMGSPQSFMANASATQGKAFENAANIKSRYQNMNVGVANQFSPMITDIINRTAALGADRADKLFWNNEQGNKAYRNNLRQWMNNVDRYRENDYQVNTQNEVLNATNSYFDLVFGPRKGSMRLKPGVNAADLILSGSGRASAGSPERLKQYEQAVANYSAKNMTDSQMRPLLEAQFPELFTDVRSNTRNLGDVTQGYLGMLSRMGLTGAGPTSLVGQ